MNKILRLALTGLIGLAALSSVAQTPTFPELAERNDVKAVYVSKAMLNSLGSNPGDIEQFSVKDLARSINTLEILTCLQRKAVREAKKEVRDYVRRNKTFETLAKIKGEGNETTIYGLPAREKGCYSEIVLCNSSDEEYLQLIVIKGNISMNDLSKFRMNRKNEPSTSRVVINNGDTTTIIYGDRMYNLNFDSMRQLNSLKGLDSLKNMQFNNGNSNVIIKRKSQRTGRKSKSSTRTRTITSSNGNQTIIINSHDE